MSHSHNSDGRDPVDVVAEEFAERLRRGEHPSISDYAARHPDLADQLRDVLPGVAQLEQLKRLRKATSIIDVRPVAPPTSFGEFRIVRELGRGGMGVVYEAVHESLGRRVALKVLPSRPNTPKIRDRFLREAQAAAKLHHTNIVPVFGVGEHDGVPYYVMQLIRGRGLNVIISGWRMKSAAVGLPTPPFEENQTTRIFGESPSPRGRGETPTEVHELPARGDWSFIARAGAEAAEALQAAHDQGVLHRDVKPGNLLVDDTGRVWVTDFGLAKMLDRDGLTETGDVLGTLPYMPPEAFHGKVDRRGDVYSLGATLYELLALETPFTSDTPAAMIRLIDTRDPNPPSLADPEVPSDLETIVLKALARDPAQRYQSAGELASDLRAFLDDRPIKARRSTWFEQARRWGRRNPTVALLSATTAAALLLAAAFGWAGYVRAKAAFARADEQRKQAEDTAARLEANLDLSLDAFEKLFEAASQEGGGPGAFFFDKASDKVAVLETILAFYDKFAEQNATNPRLQFEAGKANRRIGEMQMMLGRSEKGESAFRRAARILDPMSREYSESEPVMLELMLTYAHAPQSLYDKGKDEWRTDSLTRLWNEGRSPEPRLNGAHLELGLRLGMVLEKKGDIAGAEKVYRTILRVRAAGPGHATPFPEMRSGMLARLHLAGLLLRTDRIGEAKRLLEPPPGKDADAMEQRGPMPPFAREMLADQFQKLSEGLEKQGETVLANRLQRQRSALLSMRSPGGREGPMGGPPGREGPPDGPYPKGPFPKGPFAKGEEFPKGPPGPFGPEFLPPRPDGPPPFPQAPPPKGPKP